MDHQMISGTRDIHLPVRGTVTRSRAEKALEELEGTMTDRLTPEAFITRAIERLRLPDQKGIHTVFSGFNEAFREYFPGEDPVAWTKKLAGEGKLVVRPVKGGAMLYLAEDAPKGSARGRDALRKMGLE